MDFWEVTWIVDILKLTINDDKLTLITMQREAMSQEMLLFEGEIDFASMPKGLLPSFQQANSVKIAYPLLVK